jgi:hypothetical protein
MNIHEAEQYISMLLDFSRKSVSLFVAKYDVNIDSYFKKLVNYMNNTDIDLYKDLLSFWEIFFEEVIYLRDQQKMHIDPEIYNLVDFLYESICIKCQYTSKYIKELN